MSAMTLPEQETLLDPILEEVDQLPFEQKLVLIQHLLKQLQPPSRHHAGRMMIRGELRGESLTTEEDLASAKWLIDE